MAGGRGKEKTELVLEGNVYMVKGKPWPGMWGVQWRETLYWLTGRVQLMSASDPRVNESTLHSTLVVWPWSYEAAASLAAYTSAHVTSTVLLQPSMPKLPLNLMLVHISRVMAQSPMHCSLVLPFSAFLTPAAQPVGHAQRIAHHSFTAEKLMPRS